MIFFPKKNDSVFQLSLTELAFTLVFLLLLLAGVKVLLIDKARQETEKMAAEAQQKLAQCQASAEHQTACETIQQSLAQQGFNPDDVISALTRASEQAHENQQLRQAVADLNAQLTALTVIKELVQKASNNTDQAVMEKMGSALAFQTAFEKQMGQEIPKGDEFKHAELVANAAKTGEKCTLAQKDLRDCKGQVTHLTDKLKQYGSGFPPCWTDDAGKIQYLLAVEIGQEGLLVRKAWPPERDSDADRLPSIAQVLDPNIQPLALFKQRTRGIFRASRSADPECRHYVILTRSEDLKDIDVFNTLRLGVEGHFYKLDRTRP